MIYTNNHNLPEYICAWLRHDEYDYVPDTYSATTLMKPARMTALLSRGGHDTVIDYSDLIAMRYGTAIHSSLERVPGCDIQEERFACELTFTHNGKEQKATITGKPDMVIDNTLHDFKSTSTWSFIYGSKDDDFIKQLSIYRFLLYKNNIQVKNSAYIDYFFTDWQKSKARNDRSYPQCRYTRKEFDLLGIFETEKYICERLTAIYDAMIVLPECTPEELWQTETTYAVKKGDNKRAVRVFNELPEAELFSLQDKNYWIETRPGKVKRCNYCMCSSFCDQYSLMSEQGLIDE